MAQAVGQLLQVDFRRGRILQLPEELGHLAAQRGPCFRIDRHVFERFDHAVAGARTADKRQNLAGAAPQILMGRRIAARRRILLIDQIDEHLGHVGNVVSRNRAQDRIALDADQGGGLHVILEFG